MLRSVAPPGLTNPVGIDNWGCRPRLYSVAPTGAKDEVDPQIVQLQNAQASALNCLFARNALAYALGLYNRRPAHQSISPIGPIGPINPVAGMGLIGPMGLM